MLVLEIDYLNGWAPATDPADRERPEWPPHPDRVFMAMAAAHFETDGDAGERAALEWLETEGDPEIVLSPFERRIHERTMLVTYVPVNDSGDPIKKGKPLMAVGAMPLGRDRQPRYFPIAVPMEPRVSLIWTSANPSEAQRESLDLLCRKVSHVGHSASMVQMWVTDEHSVGPPSEKGEGKKRLRLTPTDEASRFRLRVFGQGSLTRLERLCNRSAIDEYASLTIEAEELKVAMKGTKGGEKKLMKARQDEIQTTIASRFGEIAPQSLRPTPSLWRGYVEAKPVPRLETTAESPRTHWSSDLIVLEIVKTGRQRWPLTSTLQFTQRLRQVTMSHCPDPLPQWLSGHRADGTPSEHEGGHVAFVPLPYVGATHADGHLLGLGIAVPEHIKQGELAAALNGLLFDDRGWPKPITLKLGRLGVCEIKLQERHDYRLTLASETWTAIDASCRRWASVTPIALDRHAKGNDHWEDIANIIADSCERIGLPRPVDVIPSAVSLFRGAPPTREMPRIERKRDGGKVRHMHAVITFQENVVGPILLGAGRYRGYGLCRPLTEKEL